MSGVGGGPPPQAAQSVPEIRLDHHLPSVRTHTAPEALAGGASTPPRQSVAADAVPDGGGDSWMAGPFRSAPMGYVMHSANSGTPLASPREGPTTPERPGGGAVDGDLEAPLLPLRKRPHHQGSPFESGGAIKAIVIGLINTAAGVPALIAFCAVVFKHPLYDPWVEPLCKFFFLSSALHQAIVSLRSAVPNAVGQVQDVGLIFLSAMASSIATACTQAGGDPAAALGTALLTMAVSTVLVGLGLIAVAKLRLAGVVQYLPLPAVGGYLSYVGYFCLASGLGLGCGIELDSLASWAQLADLQVALRVLPTLGSCFLMMWTMARFKHPLALPGVLLLIVAVFHAVLLAAGVTLQDAQEAGWVMKPAASTGRFWDLWAMFDMPGLSLEHIHVRAALQQVGKLVGLFLLVCFGSCMDIAAIQQDTPFRLDFNKELTTIGLSNMLSGAVGCGFTGSFIFSQTIFTGRAGVLNRLNGVVIALCEFAMFALPISIVQYLPTFFFGSLLVWFGVEIVLDWMLRSYRKLSTAEYALLWATFGCIMQWGLEAGIAAGIVMATLFFAWAYAQSQLSSFALVPGRSGIVRSGDQEAALELLRPAHLLCAQLRGFLFFGVANAISTRLHAAAQSLDAGMHGSGSGSSYTAQECTTTGGAGRMNGGAGANANGALGARLQQQADRLYSRDGSKHGGALCAAATAPKFLLLDFSRVKGIDATAARTLAALFRDLAQLDITPVVTAASHHTIRQLLSAHGAPLPPAPAPSAQDASPFLLRSAAADTAEQLAAAVGAQGQALGQGPSTTLHCHEFSSYEEGLRFCEQQLLGVAVRCGLCRPPSEAVSLEQLLRSHASQAGLPFARKDECGAAAAEIARFCSKLRFRAGEVLWCEGQPADEIFVIEQGRVVVEQRLVQPGAEAAAAAAGHAASHGAPPAEGQQAEPLAAAADGHGSGGSNSASAVRVFEFGPGCIAGAVDFALNRRRSSTATVASIGGGAAAGSGTCLALKLSREATGRMAAEAPGALNFLQAVILRAKCLDLGTAAELAIG